MEIILIVLSLAVVVLSVILFIRKPNAEIDARLAQLQAMHEKEMDMREKFHTEQRMRDTENWQRQLQAVNAQAESRFRELTAQLMQQGTKELSRNNVEQLGTLLNPLQARIAEFRKAVEDSAVEDKASRKSFQSKIEELQRLNVSLGQEAEKLASALKGQNKVQGDWGEMVLRTLLEQGGMTAGVHFTEQLTTNDSGETLRNEEGHSLRPDVVVNMPDERKLVIDSKVSLNAYLDLCDAETSAERKDASDRLVRSVRKHVDELAAKKYQDYIGSTPDFVVMFIPVEGAYIAALQHDPKLWVYAWERRVSISSPTHLFAVMHVVSNLWSQDSRNRNAQLIADKAGSLYDKLVLFMTSFVEIGKSIEKTQQCYDTTLNRLSKGKGNIMKISKDLGELGVKGKSTRGIPQALSDRLDMQEN